MGKCSRFVFQSHGLAERLAEILRDYDVEFLPPKRFLVGDLSGGFEIPALGLIVQTETDIFGETTQARISKIQSRKVQSRRNPISARLFPIFAI